MSKMRKLMAGVALATVAAAAATSANAAVTLLSFSSFQTGLNAGESLVTDFDSPFTLAPGWSANLGGTALVTGDFPSPDASAAPGFGLGANDDDPTQYLAVYGQETATFTGSAKRISFYVGSLDVGNKFTFTTSGGNTYSFDGADLGALSGAAATSSYGARNGAFANGRFTFEATGETITSVALFSKSDSLEISNIGSVVPEPATWAMMIIGFGGVGSMVRSARRKAALALA